MSFFVGKLCSCGFIVELCCLAEIKLKTLASRTSVPFGPPFVSKCIYLAQCSIVYFCHCFSHLDTIKDYVMLCYNGLQVVEQDRCRQPIFRSAILGAITHTHIYAAERNRMSPVPNDSQITPLIRRSSVSTSPIIELNSQVE